MREIGQWSATTPPPAKLPARRLTGEALIRRKTELSDRAAAQGLGERPKPGVLEIGQPHPPTGLGIASHGPLEAIEHYQVLPRLGSRNPCLESIRQGVRGDAAQPAKPACKHIVGPDSPDFRPARVRQSTSSPKPQTVDGQVSPPLASP